MVDLPNVPSQLIRHLLRTLAVVESDDRYVVNHAIFHNPHGGTPGCKVNFGGSFAAVDLGKNPEDLHFAGDFRNWKQLRAAYSLSSGNLKKALGILEIEKPEKVPARVSVPSCGTEGFRKSMEQLANSLERHGL